MGFAGAPLRVLRFRRAAMGDGKVRGEGKGLSRSKPSKGMPRGTREGRSEQEHRSGRSGYFSEDQNPKKMRNGHIHRPQVNQPNSR